MERPIARFDLRKDPLYIKQWPGLDIISRWVPTEHLKLLQTIIMPLAYFEELYDRGAHVDGRNNLFLKLTGLQRVVVTLRRGLKCNCISVAEIISKRKIGIEMKLWPSRFSCQWSRDLSKHTLIGRRRHGSLLLVKRSL